MKTIEEKEKLLSEYMKQQEKIKRLTTRLMTVKDMIDTPEQISGNEDYKKTEAYKTIKHKIMVKEEEIENLKKENAENFLYITTAIDKMEDQCEGDVLFYRYIRGLDWKEVSQKVGYSVRHIYRIYKLAIKNLILE